MSEELHLTRRGLFQVITTFLATASFAARRPLFSGSAETRDELNDDATLPGARRATTLELFLKSRGIKPAHLARESGYSRQHLLRLRLGRMEPTRRCMVAVTDACRRLSRERLRVSDLFDLQPVVRLLGG